MLGVVLQRKTNGVIRRRVASVQRGHDVYARGQLRGLFGLRYFSRHKAHALKAKLVCQGAAFLHQVGAPLDAQHQTLWRLRFEKQVVQNKTQIRFACAVIDHAQVGVLGLCTAQQRLDELVEVKNLFELAPRILVELAIAREDMQLLQQRD